MTFEPVEHFAILVGVIVSLFALTQGIRGWRKERDASRTARILHEQSLKRVIEQIATTNGGSTLLDKVEEGNRILYQHVEDAGEWFAENSKAHGDIHRRIDGLFEMLGGSTSPRKTAERHHYREGEGEA